MAEQQPSNPPNPLDAPDDTKPLAPDQLAPKKLRIIGPPLPTPEGEEDVYTQVQDTEDDEDLHPLFRATVPDDVSKDPRWAALAQINEDSPTPEEIAEELKARGNVAFARNDPKFYKVCVEYYTRAIKIVHSLGFPDKERASIYYSNRAAVGLAQKNFRNAMEDCTQAVKLNPNNLKAYWRYSKAARQINRFEEASNFLDKGLEVFPNNAELLKEKKEILDLWEAYKKKVAEEERQRAEREAQKLKLVKQRKELYDRIAERGISVGKYLYPSMEEYLSSSKGVYIDEETKELHWPVMFIYEEHMQRDFIADMCESDTFQQHLEVMFPKGQYQPWDVDKKYEHDKLEIYFICYHVYPLVLGKGKNPPSDSSRKRKVKVRQTTELRKVLTHRDYVVPGFPVFYVVVADSPFKEKFIKIDFDAIQ